MADFKPFADAVRHQFDEMSKNENELYVVDVDRDEIVDVYLNAFPPGTNPIFRECTEHDCSCCKSFIRNIGRVVMIETDATLGSTLNTVWNTQEELQYPYDVVARIMHDYISSRAIKTIFRTKETQFGTASSNELRDGKTHTWDHFVGFVPRRFQTNDVSEAQGKASTARDVLQRGLEELSFDALTTAEELINEDAIYRGAEHKSAVSMFKTIMQVYSAIGDQRAREAFIWRYATSPVARFKNTVIGTLISDLSEGVDLERAVKSFETKVAPQNYKRSSALITESMIKAALAKLKDLNMEDAVNRRFATIEDVTVNNVLWANPDAQTKMRDGLEGLLMEEVRHTPVTVKDASAISIDEFIENVLPNAKDVKMLVQNKQLGNLVSVTAPVSEGQSPFGMFKWANDFAWSYNGGVTDSIKQKVKSAGGNVDAKLRVSLAWYNSDDLDISCIDPSGRKTWFQAKNGILDIDMNAGSINSVDPVENLQWRDTPADGKYEIYVHNYAKRSSTDVGFELEVESEGQLYNFVHRAGVPQSKRINALLIHVRDGKVASIDMGGDSLESSSASKEAWGLKTETLVDVETIMLSPNYWDGMEFGNKHTFFLLKDCLNPDATRGIYNEFLSNEFMEHRKVFEVLGAKTKCPPADKQLSGMGFSSTVRDTVTLVVSNGSRSRAYNVKV